MPRKRKSDGAGNKHEASVKKLKEMPDIFKDLLRWAKERGIEVNGIEPRQIPGRGVGVVATRALKVTKSRLISTPPPLLSLKGTAVLRSSQYQRQDQHNI